MAVLVSSVLIVLLFSRISALTADVHGSAAKCTLKIAKKYFTTDAPNINLFLINSSRDDELLSLVYQSPMHSKTVTDFTKWKVNFNDAKRRFAIVVAESLDEIIFYKHQIAKLNLWNPRARYIFIIRDSCIKNLDQTVNIFRNNYIINGLVMMPSKSNQTVQEIYSWFPYENGQCGESFKARIVDVCEHGRLMENVDLFPSKVPDVMNNCPVRARVVISIPFTMPPDDGNIVDNTPLNITQGVEIMLFRTIAQYLNINALIQSSTTENNWGIATRDGNATGNIRSLVLREIEMTFGTFGAMIERRMYCDYTTSLYSEAITWCVPRAQFAPRWRNLIDSFNYDTWLSVLATYLLVSSIIWYFCNLEPRDVTSYVMFQNSLKYLFSIFLAVSVSWTPKKFSGRVVFLFWVYFAMHVLAAYQAKLITKLMRPSYEAQVNSLEQILTTGLDWGLAPSLKRYFANTDDWRVQIILKEWRTGTDVDACMHRIAYKRDYATMLLTEYARYIGLSYLDENLQSKIYCFPNAYLTFHTEMYLTKGFPLRDRMNALIDRVKQAGFMSKWQNDIQYKQFIKQMKIVLKQYPQHTIQKLRFEHIIGGFMILMVGIVSAFISFIGELVVDKIKKSKII